MPRTPSLTRRTVLKTTGAALTTATGAAYVYTASQPATGLQVSGLAVESADRTLGPAEAVSAVNVAKESLTVSASVGGDGVLSVET